MRQCSIHHLHSRSYSRLPKANVVGKRSDQFNDSNYSQLQSTSCTDLHQTCALKRRSHRGCVAAEEAATLLARSGGVEAKGLLTTAWIVAAVVTFVVARLLHIANAETRAASSVRPRCTQARQRHHTLSRNMLTLPASAIVAAAMPAGGKSISQAHILEKPGRTSSTSRSGSSPTTASKLRVRHLLRA